MSATEVNALNPISQEDEDEFIKVKELFDKAEAQIKLVELVRGEVAFPAVNELRYAGNHLLRALYPSDGQTRLENLRQARRHCQRALFDASEAGLTYLLGEARAFDEEFRDVIISNVIRNYVDIRATLLQARDFLRVRIDDRETRQEYAASCAQLFDALEPALRTMEGARDDLLKMREQTERDRSHRQGQVAYWIAAVAIGVAGLLLTKAACTTNRPATTAEPSTQNAGAPPPSDEPSNQ